MDDGVDPGRGGDMAPEAQASASRRAPPSRQSAARELTASFTPPSQVMTEIGVASDPVPAVVGTSASGSRWPCRESDAPDLVEIVARAEQIGSELGDIHRAAAADSRRRT